MTYQDIRALAAQFMRADVDNFAVDLTTGDGTTTLDADLKKQVNVAYRWMGREIKLVRADVVWSLLTNQYVYNLNGANYDPARVSYRCIRVRQATIAGKDILDWSRKAGTLSIDDLNSKCPGWMAGGTAGTPTSIAQIGDALYCYPKPSGNLSGVLVAQVLPNDLVADNDIPDIPVELHEALALATAVYAGKPTATNQEVWQRLDDFDKTVRELVAGTAARNERVFGVDGYEQAQPGETL